MNGKVVRVNMHDLSRPLVVLEVLLFTPQIALFSMQDLRATSSCIVTFQDLLSNKYVNKVYEIKIKASNFKYVKK